MTMSSDHIPKTALLLGLTGAIGGAIARALVARGWAIRTVSRRLPSARPDFPFPVDWRLGDALEGASVLAAAAGVDLIIHGVNPPGYARWREDGLPMLANAIAAAKASGATLLFPANVYVYSATSPSIVDETTLRQPTTRKGQVRLEMEEMLERAARDEGIRVIAVRAGDFFGPGVVNSWFAQALVKGGMRAKSIQLLTPPGVGHAWAYVPDLAETFMRLVERRDALPAFTLVHFAGHFDATGRMMIDAVQRAIGHSEIPIRPFRWSLLWLAAPFVGFLREALEMTWLWKSPLALDNRKLRGLIGEEPHTPLSEAVRTALSRKD